MTSLDRADLHHQIDQLPPEPITKQHVRRAYAELLRHRTDRVATDDPRAIARDHPMDEPSGVARRRKADGALDLAPIPSAPPHL